MNINKWFLYIQDHGLYEFTDTDELYEEFQNQLKIHQVEALMVIEGKDITQQIN